MSDLVIKNVYYFDGREFRYGNVTVGAGVFQAVGSKGAENGAQVIDGQGKRLVPGFIDIHTHGAAGVDVNAATADELGRIAAFFASQGTTAWHCSVLTDTPEQTLWCISQAKELMGRTGYGAELMGVHLEGPFLSSEYKGAMPEHLLRKGDAALFEEYQKAAEGAIKYITVSPEVQNVNEMIGRISGNVVVAIGHSGAEYEAAMEAIEKGARCITHTFNAMKLFHQHRPAIMGAALESDAWCEAICDGLHLHPAAVRLLLKCKGWDRVVAVSDSIMATGLPDGKYKLGVNDVVVENGDAKLASTGVRAGSTLTSIRALRNLMSFTGAPMEKVLPLLTTNPAEAMRIDDRKGKLLPDYDADCVLLDEEMNVALTVVKGEVVYKAQ